MILDFASSVSFLSPKKYLPKIHFNTLCPPLPFFHLRFRRLCILAGAGADRFHGNKHNKLLDWTKHTWTTSRAMS